jgi:hypothetical protein
MFDAEDGSSPFGEDDGSSFDALPERTSALNTVGDAFALCEELVQTQLNRAKLLKPPPNVGIAGDSAARTALLLLLPDDVQRRLFLKTAQNSAHWPRLRSLFGAPPFHFLRPEDGQLLRAAGFARGRSNMSYEEAGRVANVAQFASQFVDAAKREYRMTQQNTALSDPLPDTDTFKGARELLLQVKVPKRSLPQKQMLMKSIHKEQLFFPQPGEKIQLRATQKMLRARGLPVSEARPVVDMVVKALKPRALNAHTANLLVRPL